MRLFTPEQHKYLINIVEGRTANEIAELINNQFSLSITPRQIQMYKKNHGLKSNISTTFKQGSIPANKGTKGLYNVGGNRTSFKPGQKASNYKPLGSERIDRDGYVLIKVQDDGPWHKRWRLKHVVVWEKVNGPVPKGHCLIFLDRNKQNISLENLQLIKRSQLARLNQNNLISNNPDITKTGIIMAEIYSKIGERKKSQKSNSPCSEC
ncbi:HNH endonuclease [Bacillus sp. CRN 9]|nr:HNH endonuclease [Bacillus sp. CRN 9]